MIFEITTLLFCFLISSHQPFTNAVILPSFLQPAASLNFLFTTGSLKTLCYGGDPQSANLNMNSIMLSAGLLKKKWSSPRGNSQDFNNFDSNSRSLTKGAFQGKGASAFNVFAGLKAVPTKATPTGNVTYLFAGDYTDSNGAAGCANLGSEFYLYDPTQVNNLTKIDVNSLPAGISTTSFLVPIYNGNYDSTQVSVSIVNSSPLPTVTLSGSTIGTDFYGQQTVSASQLQPFAVSGQVLSVPALSQFFSSVTPVKDQLYSAVIYTASASTPKAYDVYYVVYSTKSGVTNCPSDPCPVSEFYRLTIPSSVQQTMSSVKGGNKAQDKQIKLRHRRLLQTGASGSTNAGVSGCRYMYYYMGRFYCL